VTHTTNGVGRDWDLGSRAAEGLLWRVLVKSKPDHGGNLDMAYFLKKDQEQEPPL